MASSQRFPVSYRVKCPNCEGRGKTRVTSAEFLGQEWIDCLECHGRGEVRDHSRELRDACEQSVTNP